jgi:CMP/dCMP kinase
MIITIDGPSASGKSTIACLLARELHYFYLNTGMLYRAFAYAVVHDAVDISYMTDIDASSIISRLSYVWDDVASMYLDGKNITAFLEEPAIDVAASRVSTLPIVRKHIDAWQHVLADQQDSVIDGRDSGSVVFAHAEHKFYVTASDEVRAGRWLAKQQERGHVYSQEHALEQITSRDRRDMQRLVAPLIIPEGARVIMNNGNDPQQVVQYIKQLF